MSQILLKAQTRLMARGIAGAYAPTAPSDLLANAALTYIGAVERACARIDSVKRPERYPGFRDMCLQMLDCALTADLIMAAADAAKAKETAAAEADLPPADPEKIVPFTTKTDEKPPTPPAS